MTRALLATSLSSFLAALTAASVSALPVLSEIFYDAEGADDGQGFVELYGAPGTDVEGFTIEGINGSNGEVTVTIVLSGSIPADGVLVIADEDGGATAVPEADLLANFDFQNGPDSVVLLDALGMVIDAVGYGEFAPDEFFAGEGDPVADGPAGSSVARVFADVDTDSNAADFTVLDAPTPGFAPVQTVPEPGSAVLLATGGCMLGLLRGRRGSPHGLLARRRGSPRR
jgi:hypothetical protein